MTSHVHTRREGGRGGWGRRKFYLRVEKCIDPNEGEALKRGREGEGGGQAGGEGGEGGAEGAEGNFT